MFNPRTRQHPYDEELKEVTETYNEAIKLLDNMESLCKQLTFCFWRNIKLRDMRTKLDVHEVNYIRECVASPFVDFSSTLFCTFNPTP